MGGPAFPAARPLVAPRGTRGRRSCGGGDTRVCSWAWARSAQLIARTIAAEPEIEQVVLADIDEA
ncbi:MAG TPA: hypothetical protein VFR44_08460 [Actinomycetota bacterium]|nr:hypothetical protein [Actinomycetota bacterium]